MLPNLATNINNTFLTITSLAILDTRMLGVIPITAMGLQVGEFIADVTNPVLDSFTFDANEGKLSLLFTEAVNITSLNISGLTLQNARSNPSQSYTLTEGAISPNFSDVQFMIELTFDDLSTIQALTELATNVNSTFIAVRNASLFDMSGNPLNEIPVTRAMQALNHSLDMKRPTLISYVLDLNSGEILLNFSETVNVNSLNPRAFGFVNVQRDSLPNFVRYNLTGGMASVNDSSLSDDHHYLVRLITDDADLDELKRMTNLANIGTDTYLVFTENAVNDASGNGIAEITPVDSYMAADVIPDTTPPELVGFSVNLNTSTIMLTFSETVNAESLDVSGLTVLNSRTNATIMYPLTGGTVDPLEHGTVINLNFLKDLNFLKINSSIFTETMNSFIAIENATIYDRILY